MARMVELHGAAIKAIFSAFKLLQVDIDGSETRAELDTKVRVPAEERVRQGLKVTCSKTLI